MNLVINGHDDVIEARKYSCVPVQDTRYPSKYKKLVSYTLNWNTRNILEASVRPTMFLTFTYNDEHYLENRLIDGDIKKTLIDDWQKFLKRLRSNISYNLHISQKDQNFRYYCISERGDEGRLHFHALFFGFDHECVPGVNKKAQKVLNVKFSPLTAVIEKSWNQGYVFFESAVPENIQYVTKYIHKRKISPDYVSLKSNGIGLSYFTEKRAKYFQENETFEIHLKGKTYYMPRYIKNKIFSDEKRRELNEKLAADISKKMRESALCKYKNTPLFVVFDKLSNWKLDKNDAFYLEDLITRCVGPSYDVESDDLSLVFAEECPPWKFQEYQDRVFDSYKYKSVFKRRL